MDEKVDRLLKLDADAAALLVQLAGGQRKQGAFVSQLIRLAAAQQQSGDPLLARITLLEAELAAVKIALHERALGDE